jgi:hypothetical protein
MQSLVLLWVAHCLGLVGSQAKAEIYKDISPLDTLADIKRKFPGADYSPLKPAWAQEWDAMYSVSGRGLSGKIIVKFYDSRPEFKKALQDYPESKDKETFQRLATASDEEALSVEWVRWVPDIPIPLQRFVSKYGKPAGSGFSDDDLQPYRAWSTGIAAYLSDDEKNVISVEFTFTKEERRKAYQAKYGFVPDFLKEDPQPLKEKPKTKHPKRAGKNGKPSGSP